MSEQCTGDDRPVVLIYSGLPGSGKSTAILSLPDPKTVVSADDYWIDPLGKYAFDPKELPKAHDACLRNFLAAIGRRDRLVVVDNTNLSVWEIAPYYRTAEAFGYAPKVVRIPCEVSVAAARNAHGVPLATIERMSRAEFSIALPPWWNVEVQR